MSTSSRLQETVSLALKSQTMLTADNITDEQIRRLAELDHSAAVRRLCKIALDDAPTHLRASVIRDARARCAEILNSRNSEGQTPMAIYYFGPDPGKVISVCDATEDTCHVHNRNREFIPHKHLKLRFGEDSANGVEGHEYDACKKARR